MTIGPMAVPATAVSMKAPRRRRHSRRRPGFPAHLRTAYNHTAPGGSPNLSREAVSGTNPTAYPERRCAGKAGRRDDVLREGEVMLTRRALVVGEGTSGLATTYRLLRSDWDVTVLTTGTPPRFDGIPAALTDF